MIQPGSGSGLGMSLANGSETGHRFGAQSTIDGANDDHSS